MLVVALICEKHPANFNALELTSSLSDVYFFVLEVKGLSLEQVDELYRSGVRVRPLSICWFWLAS